MGKAVTNSVGKLGTWFTRLRRNCARGRVYRGNDPGHFRPGNGELLTGVGDGLLGGAEAVVGFQVVDAVLPEGLLAGDEGIDAFLIPIAGEDVGRLKESSKLRIAQAGVIYVVLRHDLEQGAQGRASNGGGAVTEVGLGNTSLGVSDGGDAFGVKFGILLFGPEYVREHGIRIVICARSIRGQTAG